MKKNSYSLYRFYNTCCDFIVIVNNEKVEVEAVENSNVS